MATDRTEHDLARLADGGRGHDPRASAAAPSARSTSAGPRAPRSRTGRRAPEELIAAAHAACFSMALSHGLAQAGTPPEQLDRRRDRDVRARRGDHEDRARPSCGACRGSTRPAFVAAAEDAKGELPGLEGARRRYPRSRSTPRSAPDRPRLRLTSRHGRIEQPRRGARALLRGAAGAPVRPCGLQRPPRGGRGRAAAEGARDAAQARATRGESARADLADARDDPELARDGCRSSRASVERARGGARSSRSSNATRPTRRT